MYMLINAHLEASILKYSVKFIPPFFVLDLLVFYLYQCVFIVFFKYMTIFIELILKAKYFASFIMSNSSFC